MASKVTICWVERWNLDGWFFTIFDVLRVMYKNIYIHIYIYIYMLVTEMHAYSALSPWYTILASFFHMSGLYLDLDGGYGTTCKPGKRVFFDVYRYW